MFTDRARDKNADILDYEQRNLRKKRRYPRFVFEMFGSHLIAKFPCCIVTEGASHFLQTF